MPAQFLSKEAKEALHGAVREIEAQSAAEVVVSVRSQSASYVIADLGIGAVAALGALAFLLFSPFPFDLHWFLIDPLIAGAVVALISSQLPYGRRLLVGNAARHTRVRLAAEAVFFERGVHNTQNRTGLLVYVSLLERQVVLLADTGIDAAVPRREWHTARAAVANSIHGGGDGTVLASALEELAPLLAHHLPRQAYDQNELSDEVDG